MRAGTKRFDSLYRVHEGRQLGCHQAGAKSHNQAIFGWYSRVQSLQPQITHVGTTSRIHSSRTLKAHTSQSNNHSVLILAVNYIKVFQQQFYFPALLDTPQRNSSKWYRCCFMFDGKHRVRKRGSLYTFGLTVIIPFNFHCQYVKSRDEIIFRVVFQQ